MTLNVGGMREPKKNLETKLDLGHKIKAFMHLFPIETLIMRKFVSVSAFSQQAPSRRFL